MSESKQQELTPEQQEKIKRFEEEKAKRKKELLAALNFLTGTAGLKIHKGLFMRKSHVEFFRGVNFHVGVLANSEKLLKLMPTLIADGRIKQLKTLEDSMEFGQNLIDYSIIVQLKKDPGIVHANEKVPKYVVPVPPGTPMIDKGLYTIIEQTSATTQSFYLILIVVIVLALMCFRLWPLWLKKAIWYISFYLLVFLVVTAVLRVILWAIGYHVGLEFWLFPNYFIDSNDPRDSFLPVYSFEVRDDFSDFKSIIFRLISGSLIVYMGYQFCQDEKNIADLKDLAENGLTDLFEYGQEFMLGNALGDGSKKNTTETKEESFSEKYRRELAKDLDELVKDDDEEPTANETADEEVKQEPEGEIEEEVSSSDMFDEMK